MENEAGGRDTGKQEVEARKAHFQLSIPLFQLNKGWGGGRRVTAHCPFINNVDNIFVENLKKERKNDGQKTAYL